MLKHEKSTKFSGMSVKALRPALLTVFLLVLLLFEGCNVLKRGDYFRQSDDTLYFSQIGFLMADNPGLSRDTQADLSNFQQDIWITVPYSTDTTQPLVINYDVVGKDTIVEYEDPPGIWKPAVSGIDSFNFNNGAAPVTVNFRISKTDRITGDSGSREFRIHVEKIIRPVLLNPPAEGVAGPFTVAGGNPLIISFADENGNSIANMDTGWNTDEIYFQWDDSRLKITNLFSPYSWTIIEPPYTSGPLEGYQLDVTQIYPGKHQILVERGQYTDINGYKSKAEELVFEYSPPPVYLSQSGNDANSGLTASKPVRTWAKACDIAGSNPVSAIYIEASETPYDTYGSGMIDGTVKSMNVFGNWMPGFTERYEGDIDDRPPTILTDSLQTDGVSPEDPSAVLTVRGVPEGFVLDGITIEPNEIADNAAAFKIDNAEISISDCRFFAPPGSSMGATAVTVTDKSGYSHPRFREVHIIGKIGGSGDSTGLRSYGAANNSDIDIRDSLIVAGDIDNGKTTAIYSENSNIRIEWSYLLAGYGGPSNDTFTESENFGIDIHETTLSLNSVWVHAADSLNTSSAVRSAVKPWGGSPLTQIESSTLISGDSGESITLSAINADNGGLNLFNSVLLAGASSTGDSTGVHSSGMVNSKIMGNAVHVREGATAADSYGIHFSPPLGATDIRNNLVWSDDSSQTLGIRADIDIVTFPVRNNDFWNTSGAAELDTGDGSGPRDLSDIQNDPDTLFNGNFGLPVNIDISFDYSTEQVDLERIGRIIGAPPADVMFGGEDLSNRSGGDYIPEYPEESPEDKRDRLWNPRTGYAGIGWSLGPYEYDNGSLPHTIYVSALGDDAHPLGTQQAPFASLARAYNIARTTGEPRTDVTEIRIAEGNYDQGSSLISFDTGPDLHILGGYDKDDWLRDPAGNITEISSDGTAVFLFNAPFSREFLLDGFTLKNTSTSNSTSVILFSAGAGPEIRNNNIIGGDYDNSSVIAINDSRPFLSDNTIQAGNYATGTTTALVISNNSNPEIRNNTITGGTAANSIGVEIDGSQPLLVENTIRSGNHTAGTTTALIINNGASPQIWKNTIIGGDSANSYGINVNNAQPIICENTIRGGNSGSGGTACGAYMFMAGGTVLENNDIFGGTADTTGGIYSNNSGYEIRHNRIDAGHASSSSYGIYIDNATGYFIDANHIFGGEGSGTPYGIFLRNGMNTDITNNIVHAGSSTGTEAFGINFDNGDSSVVLANNTIYGGQAVNGSYGVHTESSAGITMRNNLIIAGGSSGPDYAVYEASSISIAQYFNNLLLAGPDVAGIPHRTRTGIEFHSPAALETELLSSGSLAVDGSRIDEDNSPQDYFADFHPGITFTEFMNTDWHLKSDSRENATSGGQDLPGVVDFDRDGNPRDSPWSIGAYEY